MAPSGAVHRLLDARLDPLSAPATPIDLAEAYADTARVRQDGRPWVMVNMITSVDGASVLGGASGGLGGPADKAVFAVIRALADVILVGASTVRAEGYGPPKKAGQRIAVVTRSGRLDWTSALLTSSAAVVVLPEDGPEVPAPTVRAGTGDVDLRAAVVALDGRVVLAEGGPTLNGQLLAAGLVDELCLTVAPRLVGGSAQRIFHGELAVTDMALTHVLEDDGFLFCRYHRRDPT